MIASFYILNFETRMTTVSVPFLIKFKNGMYWSTHLFIVKLYLPAKITVKSSAKKIQTPENRPKLQCGAETTKSARLKFISLLTRDISASVEMRAESRRSISRDTLWNCGCFNIHGLMKILGVGNILFKSV